MRPGRFLTLSFVYLGVVGLLHLGLGLATGEEFRFTLITVGGLFLPTAVAWYFGVHRLRHPAEEERPAEYGLWTAGLLVGLVVYTAWFGYVLAGRLF